MTSVAITVVQSHTSTGLGPYTFSAPVTAGNTVFLVALAYNTNGTATTIATPNLGGSTVPGTVALLNPGGGGVLNSASLGGNVAGISAWMLPNCPGSQTAVTATVNGGNNVIGAAIYEVSGLGASPVLDKSSTGSSISLTTISSWAQRSYRGGPRVRPRRRDGVRRGERAVRVDDCQPEH